MSAENHAPAEGDCRAYFDFAGRRCGSRAASVALALIGGVVAAAPGAGAQANPFQRGPNPTTASIVAPVANHAIPFFNSIPAASEKAYLELAGAGHTAANSPNTTLAKYAISWLRRYIDNDTRYEQFLCPAASGPAISQYRDTCPGC